MALTDCLGKNLFAAGASNREVLPSADNIGEYRFMWGVCTRDGGGRARLSRAFHDGRLNVCFAGGYVERLLLKDLLLAGFQRPVDNPKWTRDND